MKSILVVSSNSADNERIRSALDVEGWWITEVSDSQSALRSAADRAPDVVVVDGELPGAGELVQAFSASNGGPGALLFGAPSGAAMSGADGRLERPIERDAMKRAVNRVLNAPRAPLPAAPVPGRRLTAADIFGEVLREVEGMDADSSGAGRIAPPRPPLEERAPVGDPIESGDPSAPALHEEGSSSIWLESLSREHAARPEPPPAGPPRQFGQYELEERIAVGGMAEIWKARMTGVRGFEKTVAIKKILAHLTESEDFERMFIDEAKLAAGLSHENIIHIYDLGSIGDEYFIAMEYIEGKDLRSMLNAAHRRGERIPQGLALFIAARLASALDYAHRRKTSVDRPPGVIHRDISPRNVLVGNEGRVKLCDFGVAKAASSVTRTQIGAIKGKLQYMSPEQAWGRPVDGRSDIFSLGAVLFEMITGERLYREDSEVTLLDAVRSGRVRAPREVDPTVPPELDRIVVTALRKEPEDRYQNAGELQRDLEALLYSMRPAPGAEDLAAYLRSLASELPAARVDPLPAVEMPTPRPALFLDLDGVEEDGEEERAVRRRRVTTLGLVAGVLVVLVVLLALFLKRGSGESPAAAGGEPVRVEAVEPHSPVEAAAPALPVAAPAAAPAGPPADDVPIEDLVSRELARREAELRQSFESQQQQVLEGIDDLDAADAAEEPPPAEPPDGGQGDSS